MQINVLLVDSDQQFLKCARQSLEQQGGISVETASSSEETKKKMNRKQPDVIVCDINMPATTGFEFLKTVRDDNSVPFIVFTTTTKRELALQAFQLDENGFDGNIEPSIIYPKLKQCIEDVTKNAMNNEKEHKKPKGGCFNTKRYLSKGVMAKIQKNTIKSIIDIVILSELKNGPQSGYNLLMSINEKFRILVSPGTVYSHLYALERAEIVSGFDSKMKRNYKLTEKGNEHLELSFTAIKKTLDILEQDTTTDDL